MYCNCNNKNENNLNPVYCNCINYVCANNKTYYQDVYHPFNNHTHQVNTVVRRHYYVPTYTTSEETVFVDEYLRN